ncbi:MAG: type III-B CRISPR-associated protein Cas10/Cmr2, partial [Bryobacteraceae bacterium]
MWKLLPADTRVPDHTIWDHLDLVSAFAGVFAAGKDAQPALLTFSIGPVQSFIQAARKVEDMWAGSHLLARMAWEAAKPLCEELGPDAIIFPRLRGIALVDLWLRDEMGLPETLFEHCPWRGKAPDANPLFAAALPNRFVAIVPADRVEEIAARCRDRVRQWLLDLGLKVVDRLLEAAGEKQKGAPRDESVPAYQQMREQLRNFPEVHWASASFALCPPADQARQTHPDVTALKEAMAPFYGVQPDESAGFLATPAWQVLSREIDLPDGTVFYAPNPGVLYPAIYDLAERLLAAAKSVRAFEQLLQKGWRCTLSGESEWLTTVRDHLLVPRGRRKSRQSEDFNEDLHVETLWAKIAQRRPAWAKEGEHLGGLPAIKRLWPTLFAEEVQSETREITERFVVSTEAMALARQLEEWLKATGGAGEISAALQARLQQEVIGPVALPRGIVSE